MKTLLAAAPFTQAPILKYASAARSESEDRKCCSWFHDASHLAQSSHRICKEMK